MEGKKLVTEREAKQNELMGLLEDLKKGIDTSSNDYNNIDKALAEIAVSTREAKDVLSELKNSVESEELREKVASLESILEEAKLQEQTDSLEGMKQEMADLKKTVRPEDVSKMSREEQLRIAQIGREIDAEELARDVDGLANKGIPVVSWLAGMANK